jgi:hypothetical protein
MGKNFILDDGQQFILVDPQAPEQTSFGAPNLNTFIKVSIDLLNVKTGISKVINLINRPALSQLDAFPILTSVDNIGLKLGLVLPDVSRGSITVDNKADSFGSERRFSDLLNRYTVHERDIKIWVAQIPLGKDDVQENDFVLKWTAIGTDITFDNSKCRVNFTRADIPVRVMTYVVNRDQFPDAPSASLGKHLPIIFSSGTNEVEVEAVRLSDAVTSSNDTYVDYAFATTLANTHLLENVGTGGLASPVLMMENRSREWQRVNLKRWNAFAIGGDGRIYNDPPHSYSYIGTWDPALKEVGYKFTPGQNIDAGQVLVSIDWYLSSSISGDFYNFQPAKFTLKVYSEWNNYPDELIASSTIDCEVDYATKLELQSDVGSATKIYKFRFDLNKIIIVPENSSIFVVLERNDVSDDWPKGVFGPVHEDVDSGNVALSSFEQYYKFNTSAYLRNLQEQNQLIIDALTDSAEKTAAQAKLDADATLLASQVEGWQLQVISGGKSHFRAYVLARYLESTTLSDYQNGLGYSGFSLWSRSLEGESLQNTRFIVNATGLRDDIDGTITGTPEALLENPLHQVRALMRDWNGSAWVDKQFNHTKFADTHDEFLTGRWSISTGGATQGRQFLRDILSNICSNSMTRLVPYVSDSDYSLGLFCYGTRRDRAYVLNDENAQFLSAEIKGIESIINHVEMVYNRRIRNRTEELMAEGGFKQYQAYLDSDTAGLDMSLDELNNSRSYYGIRPLGSISFDWIQDEASARSVGALFLRRYNAPEMIVKVAVPFAECPALDGMDIIDIKFVNLPAYYGSTQLARGVLAGTEATSVDLVNGHYWKRSQRYRCAVIGNELVLRQGEPLQHILTLLVVNPIMIL